MLPTREQQNVPLPLVVPLAVIMFAEVFQGAAQRGFPKLSVATKKCAILVGRRRQWSGYGVAGGWHKNVTVDSGRIVL